MTRVLLVQRDQAVADRMADDLEKAGYEVERCLGPDLEPCPVVEAAPCPLVDGADVLVYDAWVAGDSGAGEHLTASLRELYADLPIVLTSAHDPLDWVERDGAHRVFPLPRDPSTQALLGAIEIALEDQGMAV